MDYFDQLTCVMSS